VLRIVFLTSTCLRIIIHNDLRHKVLEGKQVFYGVIELQISVINYKMKRLPHELTYIEIFPKFIKLINYQI